MTRWLKEPLIHFLLLGGLIFLVYGALNDGPAGGEEIVISRGQQTSMVDTFNRAWQRPPGAEELDDLMAEHVRQEIAYREALALGLDENDIIIRRRLRQKLELLAEDTALLAAPTDQQLQQFLDAHADSYQVEPRVSLQQVYFNRERRGDRVASDANALLSNLQHRPDADVESLSDPLALPNKLEFVRLGEVTRMFGVEFSSALMALPTGVWSGPIGSGVGVHLVRLNERIDGRKPKLDEVRDRVQRDWYDQRRSEAVEDMYQRLAKRYKVIVEPLEAADEESGP